MPFTIVSAFLRLGHKYEIPELWQSAISRLRICFPEKLSDFRNAKTYKENPGDDYLHFEPPLIHMRLEEVLGVINLARAYDLPSLLPSAFYLCSLLSTGTLIHGGRDGDGNQLLLSKNDITACIDGHITLMQEETLKISSMAKAVARDCPHLGICDIAELFWRRETGLVKASGATLTHASWLDPYLFDTCRVCKDELKKRWNRYRSRTWTELCETFGIDNLPEDWGV